MSTESREMTGGTYSDVERKSVPAPDTAHWFRDLLLLTVLFSLLFGLGLGSRSLWEPDEGRYSEIPREMLVTGDFVTPRLDGVKYFEKPPLVYWLTAGSFALFGLSETTARLWPALFALLGCLTTYAAGRRLFGRRTGLLSAAVLGTSLLYYFLGRIIDLDMAVSVLITMAMLSFLVGVQEQGRPRRRFLWAFYVFVALATLAKGLIGIVIPGMIIGAWILVLNDWRLLRNIYLPSGLMLFLVIAAPWHILVSWVNPEFPYFYFIHEHFLRYATMEAERFEPIWFFVPILAIGLYPWIAFLPQALKHSLPASWARRSESADTLFLLLWAGLVLVFFSVSKSKLIPYILPAVPPLALLIGRWFASIWDKPQSAGTKAGLFTILIVSFLFAAGLALLPHGVAHSSSIKEFVQALGGSIYVVAAALMLIALAPLAAGKFRGTPGSFIMLAVFSAVFLTIFAQSLNGLDEKRSVKSLALVLLPKLHKQDYVISYHTYFQTLPVYLQRRITIVDWVGELSFGAHHQDVRQWLINEKRFWRIWNGRTRAYAFVKAGNDYQTLLGQCHDKCYVVARTPYRVLVSNRLPNS